MFLELGLEMSEVVEQQEKGLRMTTYLTVLRNLSPCGLRHKWVVLSDLEVYFLAQPSLFIYLATQYLEASIEAVVKPNKSLSSCGYFATVFARC